MNKLALAVIAILVILFAAIILLGVHFTPHSIPNLTITTAATTSISSNSTQNLSSNLTIKVGSDPDSIMSRPNSSLMYVANYGSNNVSIINTTINKVIGSIATCSNPRSFAITPDGEYLFVTCPYQVSILNLSSQKLLRTVGSNSYGVKFASSPTGETFFILNNSAVVYVLNTTSGNILYATKLAFNFTEQLGLSLTFGTNGKYVYEGSSYLGNVLVINSSTDSFTTIPLGNDSEPTFIAMGSDGKYLYIAETLSGNLVKVNTANNKIVAQISIAPNLDSVYPSADGANRVYGIAGNSVYVINSTTNKLVSQISFNTSPYQVADTPGSNFLYVLSSVSTYTVYGSSYQNVIYIVNESTNKIVGTENNVTAITSNGKEIYTLATGGRVKITQPS